MDTRVIDSRPTDDGKAVRRRRQCEHCEYRFTTFERLEVPGCIVIKADGTREPFSLEKVERSIWIACSKRQIDPEKIHEMLMLLQEKWMGKGEITSDQIGNDVLEALKKIDHIAFIRFASVYRSFKNVEDFTKEVSDLFHSH